MSRSSSNASFRKMPVAAVVVAGGSGRRMGGVRKQYLELHGEPVLLHALRAFLEHPRVSRVVAVVPREDRDNPPEWLRDLPVELAAGGAERSDSVWQGLEHLDGWPGLVLIHDGARPLVTAELIDRVIAAAAGGVGAVAAIPATDTLKETDADGRVLRTVPRAKIWQAQTPQGFLYHALRQSYRQARSEGWSVTDDAEVYERCGLTVQVVAGDRENLKLTRPGDLEMATAILRRRLQGAPPEAPREGPNR